MYGRLSPLSLQLVHDFTRCVRPNGTVYGTAGKCRKGTERAKVEEPAEPRKRKTTRLTKEEKIAAEVMGDRSIRSDRRRIEEMVKRGVSRDTDFVALVSDAKRKLGISPTDRFPKVEKKPSGKSLAERMSAATDKLEAQPKTVKKEKPPKEVKAPVQKEKPEVKAKAIEPEKKKEERAPKAKTEVSEEKLKKSFEGVIQKMSLLKEKEKSLRSQGKTWDDPEVKNLNERIRRLENGATVLKQAYYAVNKRDFLKLSSERSKLLTEVKRLDNEAEQSRRKDGYSAYSVPKGHPSEKIAERSYQVRNQANNVKAQADAAFYGEPLSPSKPKSDGGGKVHESVPKELPQGGASKPLKDFLDGAEVVMAFSPKGFSGFVKDEEVKNGFMPKTGGVKVGRVKSYLDGRTRGEAKVLGLPPNTPPERRPVYAALENPDRSRSLQGDNQMSQYGGIQVSFKPSVKDRSTFTLGDSLDVNAPNSIQASPVRSPANPKRFEGEDKRVLVSHGDGTSTNSFRVSVPAFEDSGRMRQIPYVEAQIFGGLRLSDIQEVRIYKGHEIPSATRKKLEKAGVRIVELPPQIRDLNVNSFEPSTFNIETLAS